MQMFQTRRSRWVGHEQCRLHGALHRSMTFGSTQTEAGAEIRIGHSRYRSPPSFHERHQFQGNQDVLRLEHGRTLFANCESVNCFSVQTEFLLSVNPAGLIDLDRRWFPQHDPPRSFWGENHFTTSDKDLLQLSNLHRLRDLLRKPCLFLLGQGGSGKTAEFRWNFTSGADRGETIINQEARYLDGAGAESVLPKEDLDEAFAAGDPIRLVFDSVDEALLGRRTFLDGLLRRLEKAKIAAEKRGLTLRLVLTSRLEWDQNLAGQIASLWDQQANDCTYQLAPLTVEAAEALAGFHGVSDPRAFLETCDRHDMLRYACWPRTLIWLAEEFKNDGVISSSLTRMQEKRCQRQFEEAARSERLGETLTPERTARWRNAIDWLACISIATGCQRFVHDRSPGPSELEVGQLAGVVGEPLNLEAFVEAMKFSDLFTQQSGKWLFQEQSDVEFLAARRLAQLPVEQLAAFFGSVTKNGWQVYPQLRTTAAMTAVVSDAFREWLLQHHPLILLRADAAPLPAWEKKRIVNALLNLINEGRAPEAHDEESHLQTLRHPQLGEQLLPWLTDATRSLEAREMAIRIASECADGLLREELKDAVWQLASGPDADKLYWMSHAVKAVGVAWDKEQLMRIVRGELPSGRHWNSRGAALFALFDAERQQLPDTEHTKLSEVLPFLESNATGVIGTYDSFQYASHAFLDVDDVGELCSVLETLKDRRGTLESVHSLHELTMATLRALVRHLPNQRAISALADWWFTLLGRGDHEIVGRHGRGNLADIGLDVAEKRRALLFAMFASPEALKLRDYHLFKFPYEEEDFSWLLLQLPELEGSAEKLAARLVARLIHRDSLREANLPALLEAYKASAELRALLPAVSDANIHTTLSRIEEENRRRWAAEEERERKMKRGPNFDDEGLLSRALEKCKRGETKGWAALVEAAGVSEGYKTGVTVWEAAQPQDLPGWKQIDASDHPQIQFVARKYLLERPPTLVARNQSNLGMEATRHALCLLRETLQGDQELRAAFRQEWVEVVLRNLYPAKAPLPELLLALHEINPAVTLGSIRHDLERDWDQDRCLFPEHLDTLLQTEPEVANVVCSVLRRSPLKPNAYQNGIAWLIRHDRETAAGVAMERFDELLAQDNSIGRHVVLGTALLAFPEKWKQIWPAICGEPQAGVDCLGGVAQKAGHLGWLKPILGNLVAHADFIATLYGFLLKYLPPDPEHRGTYTPDGIDDCRELQRACYQALTESGRSDLLAEAFRFADISGQSWTRRAIRKAELNEQAAKWHPWEIESFAQWLTTDGATRIVDAGSLQRAVLESLRRFEQAWKKLPTRLLWNLEESKPHREADLSNALKLHLQNDLAGRTVPSCGSIFINREPEFFSGEATDLLVEASLPDGKTACVVVEVKLCDHREVETSMETQLANRYLREKNLTHGIYFVGWFGCSAWPKAKPKTRFQNRTLAGARNILNRRAASLSKDSLQIEAVVVPCPLSASLATRGRRTVKR